MFEYIYIYICLNIYRAAQSSEVVMGPVTSGRSRSGETVATLSLIGEGRGGLLRTLA